MVDVEYSMLHTKINLKAFLVLEKKTFMFLYHIFVIVAILFNGAEPFKQIVKTLSTEGPTFNVMKTAKGVQRRKH